jgi:hypothetical protein
MQGRWSFDDSMGGHAITGPDAGEEPDTGPGGESGRQGVAPRPDDAAPARG